MKNPIPQYWTLFRQYLRPQWKLALLLAGLLLGNIALRLVNPQIIRSFIDAAQAGQGVESLLRSALLFLGLAILQQVVSVSAGYAGELVAWTATNGLRLDLAEHCLKLDLSFHNAHTPGEMIERLDGDLNNLSNFFSRLVVELFGNLLLLLGVLALLWREDWRVGLGMTTFMAISLTITMRFRNVGVPYWKAERQASADFFGFLEERLAGTEDIRANGAEAYTLRNFHGLIRAMLRTSLKAGMMINLLLNTLQFMFALSTAAAFAISAFLFNEQVLTIGAVYLIFAYTSMLQRPIDAITHEIDHLQRAGAGIVRVQELLAIENKIQAEPEMPCTAPRLPDHSALSLQFEAVSFGYADASGGLPSQTRPAQSQETNPGPAMPVSASQAEQPIAKEMVLSGIDFYLPAGQVLGLLGRTGSGKTTLTRLLFRFYDPDQGTVRLGSNGPASLVDLRQLPLHNLRQRVGMVTQNIQLFNASVRDNLTFFDNRLPDEKIAAVIAELGLQAWFEGLPQGLDTVLESGGGGLSAGEAQLLALTRVFLFDPGLIVLDEASSRLDPATETLIEQAIARLLQGRTAIVIAHRLSTVQKADQIMILEQGRIQEFGARTALAADPHSRFHALLQTGLEEVLV